MRGASPRASCRRGCSGHRARDRRELSVVGPAAAHFGWRRDDWDALARRDGGRPHPRMRTRRRPAATTASSPSTTCSTPASPSPRFMRTARASSPSIRHGRRRHDGDRDRPAALRDRRPALSRAGRRRAIRHHRARPDGADRVRVSGVRGEPPPPTLKVCCNTWADIETGRFVLCGSTSRRRPRFYAKRSKRR